MLVFELASDAVVLLGPHRTRDGWEVCEAEDPGVAGEAGMEAGRKLWLRCPEEDAAEQVMAGLPCAGRYRAGPSGGLVPLGKTLPVAKMPAGPWMALPAWLEVTVPRAVLPGRCQDRAGIRLERSGREEAETALLMSLEALTAWTESASRLRMGRLRFAVSRFGTGIRARPRPVPGTGPGTGWLPGKMTETPAGSLTGTKGSAEAADGGPGALVLGEPPPPVPGQACYGRGRLLLPCGWDFAPPVVAAWVEEALALPPGAVALLDPSGSVELLEQESFVPLSLAAVRRTWRGLGGGRPLF